MFQAAYRFFDQPFLLETDSPPFLARFDLAYGRFRLAEAAAPPGAPAYRVLLAGRPEATIDGRTVRSDDPAGLELWAANAVVHDATARVRSHFLFHAAALRRPDGQGAILAGAAGLGKTTLALALLDRGWGLLSDDVAALDRASGRLDPFPRSPAVRVPGGRPGEKRLLEAPATAPACPARFLFVLAEPGSGRTPDEPCYLALDRAEEGLLADLEAIPGVRRLRLERGAPHAVVRLDLAPGALPAVEAQVEEACQRAGALLFDFVRGQEGPPDFRREPRLEALPPAEAGRELLAHLKGGRRSAVLRQAFGGSAARLYLALAAVAGDLACFRLAVGRLEAMVDRIQGAEGGG